MFLKNLKLTNFRNFANLDLDLSRVTLLIGDNAQGKSNLLESIYFLATTKSPRAEKDVELVSQDEDFTRVEGEVGEDGSQLIGSRFTEKNDERITNNDEPVTKLEIGMQRREDGAECLMKRSKVNGIPRRAMDYIGNLIVVYFSPEDINLVTGAPSLRRWHIDLTLAQIDREYKEALTSYHSAISSRNRLLKGVREGLSQVSELDFWTKTALESGQIVAAKRRHFFEEINNKKNSPEFGFLYHENVISPERLEKYLPKEIAAAASLIGPHRDDFTFVFDVTLERSDRVSKDSITSLRSFQNDGSRNLAHYGSRGEQRTAVLQLKMAELHFIKELKGVMPILLLDDVFSELDDKHRHHVISAINGQQTILSAVEESQVPCEFLKLAKLIRVKKGRVVVG